MSPRRIVVVTRWKVIVAYVVMVTLAVLGSAYNTHRIDDAEKRIARNTEIAIAARLDASRVEDFVQNFKSRLQSEKVCSESNRGDSCRALFQRLSEDLSPEQRRALSCAVAQELQLPQYRLYCG